MNGAGAAAISICRLLLKAGFKDVTLCDRKGAIYEGRTEGMNPVKEEDVYKRQDRSFLWALRESERHRLWNR